MAELIPSVGLRRHDISSYVGAGSLVPIRQSESVDSAAFLMCNQLHREWTEVIRIHGGAETDLLKES